MKLPENVEHILGRVGGRAGICHLRITEHTKLAGAIPALSVLFP